METEENGGGMFARMLSKKRSISFENDGNISSLKSREKSTKNVLAHLGQKLYHKIDKNNE